MTLFFAMSFLIFWLVFVVVFDYYQHLL